MQAQKRINETATPTEGSRRPRKWLWGVIGVLVVLLMILLLVPVVLSSRGFTRWLQAKISHSTGSQARIQDLSVGWFRGVQIAGFSLRGPNGWMEVDIDRITTTPRYAGLLTGSLALGRTVIDEPRVAVDLRERPPSTKSTTVDMNELNRIREVVIRDGRVRLTDTRGQTAQLANLNSDLLIRPPGQTSKFNAGMIVLAADQPPGRLTVVGQATPSKKTGWSLKGTSGQVTVDVNNLNLSSVTPFLDLAGVQVRALGEVSGTITSAIQDGQIENIQAAITGQNLDITGPALKGDQLRTAQLNVRARLTQAGPVIDVNQLDVRTDWAAVSLTGRIPKTPESLSKLLESGSAYSVAGNFDINLAALLTQMPNTIGVRPGMEITGGRATGNINTITQNGRATLIAKAQVAGLAGTVNNQQVRLSEPIQSTVQLSSGPQGARLDSLNVTAPFATVNANGSFQQIHYQAQTDLALLQSQLGSFVNLGSYKLAGRMTTEGQLALEEKVTGVTGTLTAQQLVLAAPDGNSVSEPQANVAYTLGLDRQQQVLAVRNLTAQAGFGNLSIRDAVVPLGPNAPAPLSLVVLADNVDLSRLEPYGVLFASLPKELQIAGMAQSRVNVTRQQGVYRFSSEATQIQNFVPASANEPPFRQSRVTASFDVLVDPNQKTIDIQRLLVESPQIKIQKGQFTRARRDSTVQAQGTLDAQVDWAAVAPLASRFIPGQLSLTGQRPLAINFTSTYPANQPNGLLAHLNSQASLGFDRVTYLGFNFGPTQVVVRSQEGLMTIGPVSTTVNNGKLNFVGHANLRQSPGLLTTPTLVHVAQGIEINQQTAQALLKYVNPIFADAVSVSGAANFDVRQMSIPLAAGARNLAQLEGTLWIDRLQLGASSILNQIFSVAGQSIRGQTLTVHPTALVLEKGIVRYDDMQIDIGQNPVNFRGSIGLDGALNMTVVLPYTIDGRLVRVGQPPPGDRIIVPLTGTISKPELDIQKFIESQLQQQIMKGLGELLKKR